MSEDNSDDSGPAVQFEWNFPVIRILTTRASKVSTTVKARSETVGDRFNRAEESEEDDTSSSNEELDGIRDRLSNIRSGGGNLVGSSDNTTVTLNGGVFTPIRAGVGAGGEVTWRNDSDEDVTLSFNDGEELLVSAGETATRDFDEERALEYSVQGVPSEELCGVVLVGDVESPNLACETDIDRVFLEEDDESSVTVSAPSSMSAAAEEKEELRNDIS